MHGECAEHENEVLGRSAVKWIYFRWRFSLCCPVLGPWPWHLVQSREGFLCWRPKIDLSHFTSWCCCPLPKSTLTRTTAPLFASVCSGEPCTSALCTEPLSNLSLHSCRSSSPPVSFFDCLGVPPPSFVSLPLPALFLFFFSHFSICVLLCSSFFCITLSPVRSIYLCMAESFPSARVCYSLLLLHFCLPGRHSPALHLQHWALLRFC